MIDTLPSHIFLPPEQALRNPANQRVKPITSNNHTLYVRIALIGLPSAITLEVQSPELGELLNWAFGPRGWSCLEQK